MTTSTLDVTATTTLADLCEAITHARQTEKRLILRADAHALPAIRARIADLVARYEAALDADVETAPRVDNSTYTVPLDGYNPQDIASGFHVMSHNGRGYSRT